MGAFCCSGCCAHWPSSWRTRGRAGARSCCAPASGSVRGRPRRTLLAGGACVAGAGTAAAALAASPAAMLAGVVVAGLGTSVCAPTILSLAGDRSAPELRASSISVVTTLGYGGFVLGPAAVGLTASATSLRTAFYGVGVVAAALAIASLAVLPSGRASHDSAETAPGAPG
ncbi:MFS transporter [Kitasatospora sp. NPDC090091]|uniref:MFS transporter n=1 Tax=Kitasatospora sp. NPDC090091 TaxID=3364081 RepID=UPI003805C672